VIGKRVLFNYGERYVPAIIEEIFAENIYGVSYLIRGEWNYVQAVYGKDTYTIKDYPKEYTSMGPAKVGAL